MRFQHLADAVACKDAIDFAKLPGINVKPLKGALCSGTPLWVHAACGQQAGHCVAAPGECAAESRWRLMVPLPSPPPAVVYYEAGHGRYRGR